LKFSRKNGIPILSIESLAADDAKHAYANLEYMVNLMNLHIKEAQVLYNARGKRTHVLLPFNAYVKLLEYLEDLEDIQAIKEVEHERLVPWEKAKRILSKTRKK